MDFFDVEEEDKTESTLETAEERINARRIRIQKRIEAQRKAQLGEEDLEKNYENESMSRSREQMVLSWNRLNKLIEDGMQLVTNVCVASSAREVLRRNEDTEANRIRKERVEAEAKVGTEKFEEITRKWKMALEKEIPQVLHEMLMQQKSACDSMIEEKNKLMTDLESELQHKHDQYVADLKKQSEEASLILSRMEEQVKSVLGAYREEIEQIEAAFFKERQELLERNKLEWQGSMEAREEKENNYMTHRSNRVDNYEKRLNELRLQDAEEYNEVKIKLETDVQILEQQIQLMKATYQLNQEKLEYNYQVLRKREEENSKTKNQQKRKITKIQDQLTNMRQKLTKQERQFRDENQQLQEDYTRVTEQFRDLKAKSRHFIQTGAKQFSEVWKMNEEECKKLVDKVLSIDEAIYTQQLGLKWEKQDITFMENVGPICVVDSKKSEMKAMQVVKDIFSRSGSSLSKENSISGASEELDEEKSMSLENRDSGQSRPLMEMSPNVVRSFLELLCEEAGFLIEAKLKQLLEPLEEDEQTLMKLDVIFHALSIETEEDIHTFVLFFLQYKISLDAANYMPDDEETLENEDFCEEFEQNCSERITSITGQSNEHDVSGSSLDLDVVKKDDRKLIHPNDLVKALRTYVEKFRRRRHGKHIMDGQQFEISSFEHRDSSKDAEYWSKYENLISEDRKKLWEALLEGLHYYRDVLFGRSELLKETDMLRQQNSELRLLLHQYINSKVNSDLQIPPTKVMQGNVSSQPKFAAY